MCYCVPCWSEIKFSRKIEITFEPVEVVQCALEVFGRKVARCSGTFFSFQLSIPAENHHLSRDDHLSKVGILACARIVRLPNIINKFVLCHNIIISDLRR